jgi:hypothetical protein
MAIYYRIEETVGAHYIVWNNMFTTMESAVEYIDWSCKNENHRKRLRVAAYDSNGWSPVRMGVVY